MMKMYCILESNKAHFLPHQINYSHICILWIVYLICEFQNKFKPILPSGKMSLCKLLYIDARTHYTISKLFIGEFRSLLQFVSNVVELLMNINIRNIKTWNGAQLNKKHAHRLPHVAICFRCFFLLCIEKRSLILTLL